jgi:hypothetical protein
MASSRGPQLAASSSVASRTVRSSEAALSEFRRMIWRWGWVPSVMCQPSTLLRMSELCVLRWCAELAICEHVSVTCAKHSLNR